MKYEKMYRGINIKMLIIAFRPSTEIEWSLGYVGRVGVPR